MGTTSTSGKPAATFGAALLAASLGLAVAPAGAAQSVLFEKGTWRAVEANRDRVHVCFVIASPTQRLPPELRRDPGFFFVTLKRGAGDPASEISAQLGFRLASADHSLAVDGHAFVLQAAGESAWLKSVGDEGEVVRALRAGSEMRIAATSARGNATTDVYDLSGFSAALSELQKRCRP